MTQKPEGPKSNMASKIIEEARSVMWPDDKMQIAVDGLSAYMEGRIDGEWAEYAQEIMYKIEPSLFSLPPERMAVFFDMLAEWKAVRTVARPNNLELMEAFLWGVEVGYDWHRIFGEDGFEVGKLNRQLESPSFGDIISSLEMQEAIGHDIMTRASLEVERQEEKRQAKKSRKSKKSK